MKTLQKEAESLIIEHCETFDGIKAGGIAYKDLAKAFIDKFLSEKSLSMEGFETHAFGPPGEERMDTLGKNGMFVYMSNYPEFDQHPRKRSQSFQRQFLREKWEEKYGDIIITNEYNLKNIADARNGQIFNKDDWYREDLKFYISKREDSYFILPFKCDFNEAVSHDYNKLKYKNFKEAAIKLLSL